jgi:hypothetical protein
LPILIPKLLFANRNGNALFERVYAELFVQKGKCFLRLFILYLDFFFCLQAHTQHHSTQFLDKIKNSNIRQANSKDILQVKETREVNSE